MARIVKAPEVRRAEILSVASELFHSQGYRNTSVEAIIKRAGIAKGTFYHYFQSKEEVLAAIADELVALIGEKSRRIADDTTIGPREKLNLMMFAKKQAIEEVGGTMLEDIHHPENRELHEQINIKIILVFAPIVAEVVEEGKREGLFHLDNVVETVQFLLSGFQFLFGFNLFGWSDEEEVSRLRAMQTIVERAFGAESGSLAFLTNRECHV